LTPGSIMAAITYLTQILGGIGFLANIFQTFTRAKASADRINEVLESPPSIEDGENEQIETGRGTVEFRDVCFAYPGTSDNVLEHIDLTVRRGETLAIIGSTGSGKTTLVDLIPRFYDVSSGEVLVDGRNVKDYKLTDLRDKISVVMQRSEIYSRPIEENIRWGAPDASPEQIKAAGEAAQADGFICEKEYGYHTVISEGGHSLSGGQKQRVCVARALLKPHEILIFDDATSALDLRTEASLYDALGKQDPDSTKIIIAQRIASVRRADRIIVLDNGRIAASGTHETLMEASEIYRDIYRSQQREGGAA
ncbi:MAG: ABC transporter ATP-binding protein, partial [Clostridia bacterium]|nr:ABC transporter ATP-binding protein [Clostridia bacterium]